MASYQYDAKKHAARFHFRYGGRQLTKIERVESERHAQRIVALIEETLLDLERGKLVMPPDVETKSFILTGGKVVKRPETARGYIVGTVADPLLERNETATIGSVFDTYAKTLTPGSKEKNSIYTEAVHGRHFKRVLGADRRFDSISVEVLQRYVNKRAGQDIARDTIHKELTTLRVVWGWAYKRELVSSPLAWRMDDLTLPKADESPPFQTWDQIIRKVERGGLTETERSDLWECLWLDQGQTTECLDWVCEHATRPFLYPMVAFAAYTGARRSEILRSERDDWDFTSGVVIIRQKKSDKTKSFTRRSVPIHPALGTIMRAWFAVQPGSRWTISTDDDLSLSPQVSTGYFRRLMKGGKWAVLRGWHTFRHSLASNMASSGVDQRIISEILGHRTEEMERRYRHLLPGKQENAMNALFRNNSEA